MDFRIGKSTLDDNAATDTTGVWTISSLLRLLANRFGGAGSIRLTDGVDEVLVTDGKALLTAEPGAANFAATQVSVAATATLLVGARATRRAVMVTQAGTTAVYIGASNVTTSTGDLLAGTAGAYVVVPTTAAVYGIVASGTQTVTVMEIWD